ADTPHFAKDGGTWPVHCVAGTWGAELHPRLVVAGQSIRKGTGGEDGYSGFTMVYPTTGVTSSTGLEELLRAHDIARVVVLGLATDYCVRATVLDARRAGFPVTVLLDGIAGIDEAGTARALEEMRQAGASVGSSSEFG
ncbi:MAG: isochorismatase family protein, partial [Burkholderiales bacterium]